MTNDLDPGFCATCGQPFTTNVALDAHQLGTGHEMDQPDHPLHRDDTRLYDATASLWQTLADTMNALEKAGQGPSPYSNADNGDHEIYAGGSGYVVEFVPASKTWALKKNW
jgi:hypothetical protein